MRLRNGTCTKAKRQKRTHKHNAQIICKWFATQAIYDLQAQNLVFNRKTQQFGVAQDARLLAQTVPKNGDQTTVLIDYIPTPNKHIQHTNLIDLCVVATLNETDYAQIETKLGWTALAYLTQTQQKWPFFKKLLQAIRSQRMHAVVAAAAKQTLHKHDTDIVTNVRSPLHPDRICRLFLMYAKTNNSMPVYLDIHQKFTIWSQTSL